MDYRGGLKAMYNNPNWLMQTSIMGLVSLIPIVGQIVLLGYTFEAAAYLHKTNREQFPDFNFNRFGPYLARGVGPFLTGLLFLILHIPAFFGTLLGFSLLTGLLVAMCAGTGENTNVGIAIGIYSTAGFLYIIVAAIVHTLIAMYQVPLMIRGGMSGEFSESFRFSFCNEFVKRAGTEIFMSGLFLMVLSVCLAVFIGGGFYGFSFGLFSIPATGIYFLVLAWLSCQLYRAYLTEKGQPFRVKCEIIDE